MRLVGKWSPNSNGEDQQHRPSNSNNSMWYDEGRQRRSGSVQMENAAAAMTPVWTPRSAHSSPVASRKQFRPVQFQSPKPERKFTSGGVEGTGDVPIPPWEQPGFDKLPPPVHHQNQGKDHKNKAPAQSVSSSVRRLAQSFSAPKLNAGVVDGGGGGGHHHHSEPYSKHSRYYVCPPTRSLFEGNITSSNRFNYRNLLLCV